MRIVYLTDSVSEIGGLQCVTVLKVNALADIPGNEVWLVLTDNSKSHFHSISEKVHVIDLAVNYYEDDWKSNINVLKGIVFKRLKHKRLLREILPSIKPDVVISTGTSEKNLILRIKGDWATVREIHSVRNYRHLTAKGFFQIISAYAGDLLDYGLSIRKNDRIVVLTEEDKKNNWQGYGNVVVIPNPVVSVSAGLSPLTDNKIAAVGRLVPIKGFSYLIRSFKKVSDSIPGWKLDIWGEGWLKSVLKEEVDNNGLTGKVCLRGSSNSVQQELPSYSIFVCTALFEGFGLSILEAMSCGLPVVSFDCDYGPRAIIEDGKDGFLVPIGNMEMFADRICLLIENEELRKRMGNAALEKSKQYSVDRVIGIWMDLFEELCKEKRKPLKRCRRWTRK